MEGKNNMYFLFHQRLRFPLVNDAFCKYLVDNFAKMHLIYLAKLRSSETVF